MFRVYEAEDANLLWQSVRESFLTEKLDIQSSRAGPTREILHAGICLHNPRQRWIYSRFPAINVAFALAELVWIVKGRQDSEFLNYFNRALPRYAGEGEVYHGAYGFRLRTSFGVDQLEMAYAALRNNSHSRQVVLQIWDPKIDLPDERGRERAQDIPCNISSIVKVREGRLEWLQIMRSNDIFRGLPYNLVQFTSLQEVLAGWLGIDVGGYHQISDSLHLYKDSQRAVEESVMGEQVSNTDSIALNKNESDFAFRFLESLIELIIKQSTTVPEVIDFVQTCSLPAGFSNYALVIAAEGVRRKGRHDLAETLMQRCGNPALKKLYASWMARVSAVR